MTMCQDTGSESSHSVSRFSCIFALVNLASRVLADCRHFDAVIRHELVTRWWPWAFDGLLCRLCHTGNVADGVALPGTQPGVLSKCLEEDSDFVGDLLRRVPHIDVLLPFVMRAQDCPYINVEPRANATGLKMIKR